MATLLEHMHKLPRWQIWRTILLGYINYSLLTPGKKIITILIVIIFGVKNYGWSFSSLHFYLLPKLPLISMCYFNKLKQLLFQPYNILGKIAWCKKWKGAGIRQSWAQIPACTLCSFVPSHKLLSSLGCTWKGNNDAPLEATFHLLQMRYC